MSGNVVGESRVSQRVRDESLLAMIDLREFLQGMQAGARFRRLARHIVVQLFQRPPDDPGLMDDEIGQVVFIRLRVQESRAVLSGRFAQELGDGDEFEQPVA